MAAYDMNTVGLATSSFTAVRSIFRSRETFLPYYTLLTEIYEYAIRARDISDIFRAYRSFFSPFVVEG